MIYSKEKIAFRLKEERMAKGWTQKELAEKLNYSKPTVIEWERQNGQNRIPDNDTLVKMCNLYDCEIGYLLCEYDTRFRRNATIHDETGLSEDAIDALRYCRLRAEDFDYDYPLPLALSDPIIPELISFLLTYKESFGTFGEFARIVQTLQLQRINKQRLDAIPEDIRDACCEAYQEWLDYEGHVVRENYQVSVRKLLSLYNLADNYPERTEEDLLKEMCSYYDLIKQDSERDSTSFYMVKRLLDLIETFFDK